MNSVLILGMTLSSSAKKLSQENNFKTFQERMWNKKIAASLWKTDMRWLNSGEF